MHLQHFQLYNIDQNTKENTRNRNDDIAFFVAMSPMFDINNSFALTVDCPCLKIVTDCH